MSSGDSLVEGQEGLAVGHGGGLTLSAGLMRRCTYRERGRRGHRALYMAQVGERLGCTPGLQVAGHQQGWTHLGALQRGQQPSCSALLVLLCSLGHMRAESQDHVDLTSPFSPHSFKAVSPPS